MRRRAGLSRIIVWFRRRPIIAAIVLSAITLALIGGIVVRATLLRPVAVRSSPTPSGIPTITAIGNTASFSPPLFHTPSVPPAPTPASAGAFPPVGFPATGSYPPFYPPATAGSTYTIPSLNCRLPVYAGGPGSGGFIVFPGGTFVADPTSNVALPSPSPGTASPSPTAPGYQPSTPGLSYDRQLMHWLPVPDRWVSPDGGHYAYAVSDGIYVVNVASSTQSEVGPGQAWEIVGVENDGVYAGKQNQAGLWLLSFAGASKQVSTVGYWQAASSTAAYGTATAAVPQGATNTIIRLDFSSGLVSDFFTRAPAQSLVAGFDGSGNPIIYLTYPTYNNGSFVEIWTAKDASSALPIAGFSYSGYAAGFNAGGTPIGDTHGVWFAGSTYSSSGLALYVAGTGFYWMSSIGGQLAGGCY
jgi:hypothetical protein